ncbi:FtsX-like permease family protein [Phytohabitans sp. ZYX-F-186]|uniref:FtsX-like permease family protein n=1 Tax=Phytohabitans maris TaxID=3071409 RepID=A0ABU0ZJE1_9ACTN|nr:FtsX-like permease family protein [Phytohabitans sp. ZYX-F-186]MDQ7906395.1 FtsX-like permease family protein [Phytohabitans sp. ZYX-F-186]
MRGLTDLLMGARLAFAGGRDGWTRTVLTAIGVGIGVAMLLLAAAVPAALDARTARGDARDPRGGQELAAGPATLLVAGADTEFRGVPVRGVVLRPEGLRAPVPPGLAALPRAGEVAVSPALRDVLESGDGPLFAPRLGGARVVGTIADEGLAGPRELAFYLGSDTLSGERAKRVDGFGTSVPSEGFGPVLMLLVVIIFVVLLLPIAVFLGAAVRFGGERRDRRMAAFRLVGADRRTTRRIAAGEAAAAALLGVAVGGVLFALGRQLVPLVTLWDLSVFAADVRPGRTAVLVITLAVPALAVVVSMVALRGVVFEPLGVVRRATGARRRLWWRLILPLLGLALLFPLFGNVRTATADSRYQVAAGAVLLLIGAVTLLPWLIDLVVRRMRGGAVPWQLAVRRLQVDSATSARLVNGIAVAVAGTIGLQMLFAGVQNEYRHDTGADPGRARAYVHVPPAGGIDAVARLAATPGVTRASGTLQADATPAGTPDRIVEVYIGDCAALAELAYVDGCGDGDVFVSNEEVAVGDRLSFGAQGPQWTVPVAARRVQVRLDPVGWTRRGVLATPAALDAGRLGPLTAGVYVRTDSTDPDAIERVRNAAAAVTPLAYVSEVSETEEARRFTNIRRGLYIGAVVTLLLVGASLLVGVLEQLRERRRLLAMLVAVGTRRGTLAWSVVWQTVVPVLLGLVLAVGFGLALGAALLRMVSVTISVSWDVVGLSVALAAAVMAAVTLLSLPPLWRLMRPDGLRTE